jgi:hypothetical protein
MIKKAIEDKQKAMNEVLAEEIAAFGKRFVRAKVLEELLELEQALVKLETKSNVKQRYRNVQDELADAIVRVNSLRLMFGPEKIDKLVKNKVKYIKQKTATRKLKG